MFNVEITYKIKKPKRKGNTLESSLLKWQKDMLSQLSQMPGKPKYPIRWTSERQRKAFFATKGFGRGIPTKRTGKVAEWAVFVDYAKINELTSFTYQVILFLASLNPFKKPETLNIPNDDKIAAFTNPTSYQRYVTGEDQQGFHADTGWIKADPIIEAGTQSFIEIFKSTGTL